MTWLQALVLCAAGAVLALVVFVFWLGWRLDRGYPRGPIGREPERARIERDIAVRFDGIDRQVRGAAEWAGLVSRLDAIERRLAAIELGVFLVEVRAA